MRSRSLRRRGGPVAGLLALALLAPAGAEDCPTRPHSGKWTGTSPDLTVLSLQVVNHFGDALEREGPPRSLQLMARARQLRGASTGEGDALDGEELYRQANLEAIWYERLGDAVEELRATVDDLDLDCDARADREVAEGFFTTLQGWTNAERRGPATTLALRGLQALVGEVARAAADTRSTGTSRDPASALRLPITMVWLARAAHRRPRILTAASRAHVRSLLEGPLGAGDPGALPGASGAHHRRTEDMLRAAARVLGAPNPATEDLGPLEGRSYRGWLGDHRELRYAASPDRAPRELASGTGDGEAPPPGGTVLLGTGSGNDPSLAPYLVRTAVYEP